MRRTFPLLLSALLAVLAAVAWSGPARASAAAPAAPAAAATQQVTVRYGPFNLPAGSMDQPGALRNSIQLINKPCVTCDITGMKPNLVYADGTEANMDTGPMLHHFVISNLFGNDSICGGRPGGA